jgi:hypothetical protein
LFFVHFLWAIALSVLRFTASDYTFGIFWPLHCLSFDLRLLITPLISLAIALSFLRFTSSDYTFGIIWPLHCLSFDIRLLVTLTSNHKSDIIVLLVTLTLTIILFINKDYNADVSIPAVKSQRSTKQRSQIKLSFSGQFLN